MICKSCKNKDTKHKFERILLNNNDLCTHCDDFSKKIDAISLESKIQYQSDLKNWMYLNTPLRDGDRIIIANSKKFDFPFCDGTEFIEKIVREKGLSGNEYHKEKEKFQVVNMILGGLYDDLYDGICLNPAGLLVALLNCLAYNRFICFEIISWAKEQQGKSKRSQDRFVNVILDTFDMLNLFRGMNTKQYNDSFDLDILFVKLESLLASDKLSLEHGIELIYNRYREDMRELDNNKPINLVNIINILRAIHKVNFIKVSYSEGEKKNFPLVFDSYGRFILDEYLEGLEEKYMFDMINQKPIFEMMNYNEKINCLLEDYLGFDFDLIDRILNNIFKEEFLADDFWAGDKTSWCEVIARFGECTYQKAEAIFKYLLYNVDGINIYEEKSRKNRRITRMPILMIDEIAFCTGESLIHALIFFKIDIYQRDINHDVLMNKLNRIYESIDTEFEKNVLKSLSVKFPEAHIKGNLRESDLLGIIELDGFPGQIDVIMLLQNALFIIECKNFSLKSDLKPRANEYSKLTKSQPKSIQGKLSKKVKWVSDNIRSVIKCLGAADDKIYDVYGVITTSNFSIASMETMIEYPVVTWTNLPQWIEQKSHK